MDIFVGFFLLSLSLANDNLVLSNYYKFPHKTITEPTSQASNQPKTNRPQLPSKDGFPETSVVVACIGISLANPCCVLYCQLLACTLCPVLEKKKKRDSKKKENTLKTTKPNAQTTRTSQTWRCSFLLLSSDAPMTLKRGQYPNIKFGTKHIPGSILVLIIQIWKILNQEQKSWYEVSGQNWKMCNLPQGSYIVTKYYAYVILSMSLNNHRNF